jgi:hypothetical protein
MALSAPFLSRMVSKPLQLILANVRKNVVKLIFRHSRRKLANYELASLLARNFAGHSKYTNVSHSELLEHLVRAEGTSSKYLRSAEALLDASSLICFKFQALADGNTSGHF